MKSNRSVIAIALGLSMVGFGAGAQTNQAAPPNTPDAGARAPAATPGATSPAGTPGATAPTATPDARDRATPPDAARMTQEPVRDNDSQLNQYDYDFLEDAIQGSYAEVEGSQLALEKTESADVRQFAEKMIKDHGEMLKEATKLAEDKGMDPPDGPSAMQTTEITGLRALTGGAFDAMYVNRIGVAAHESTVEMFEEASREAQDPDVKAMVEKALPKLREHLEMAQALDAKQDRQD